MQKENATIAEFKQNTHIQIRRWSVDLLFDDLERIQQEMLFALTANINDKEKRKKEMERIGKHSKYNLNGIARKILKMNIDSVKAEDLI